MEVSSRTFALSCPVNWFEVIDVSFASLSAQDTIILELMDTWTRCVSDSPKDFCNRFLSDLFPSFLHDLS